jgi:cell division protein FtsL
MLDLAAGIEERNYGLKKKPDTQILRESMPLVFLLAIIATALFFHVWICSQTLRIGYQSQELNSQEQELLRSQQHLIVEEQTLKDPKWLAAVAGRDLGMTIVRADQIIPAPIGNWNAGNVKPTLIGNLIQASEPVKPSSLN